MAQYDVPDLTDRSDAGAILERQHGVLTTRQLARMGVGRSRASSRVAAGRWQRPYLGVYAVFSGPLDRLAVIWAALLRCGEGTVASHETAAELDGFAEPIDERVHVTVGAHRRVAGRLSGIVIHYAHRLPQTRHPARCPPRTRVDETVLDLLDAARSGAEAVGWLMRGVQRRVTTPTRLSEALARRKKIRWRPMAEAVLLDMCGGAHSMLELEHLRRVERAHGLPQGHRQRREAGARVIWIDVDYDEYATRVELDGRVGHQGEGAFRDRRRDNRAAVSGRWTLRYGHAEVVGTPCAVAAEQAVVLQDRGWRGSPRRCSADCVLPAQMANLRSVHIQRAPRRGSPPTIRLAP